MATALLSVVLLASMASCGSSGDTDRGTASADRDARTGIDEKAREREGEEGEGEEEHPTRGRTQVRAVRHDTGPRLSSLDPAEEVPTFQESEGGTRGEVFPHPDGTTKDPVVQTSAAPVTASAPTAGANFRGLGSGFTGPQGTFSIGAAPPDANAAAGPGHLVQIVNSSIAVLSKAGTVLYGPVPTNTLFTGFGGACESTNDGDGIVRYDSLADRWVISQFAVSASTGPYLECIAVSTGSSPTGSYNRYAFAYANFPDYPKLGVWPDAYYLTYNMFGPTGFSGAQVCAMDRARMLAGLSATQKCFTTSALFGGLLPADVDGANPPPAGAPAPIVGLGFSTTLATWKFHADFATPASATFTGPVGVTVAAYDPACDGGTCIPQPGTSNQLDSLGDRLMNRLAYRNFGDHQSLVLTHAVNAGTSVGVRWYELRLPTPTSTPTVHQQGTYAPDSGYRWMSSAAQDRFGNIGLAYSRSSSTVLPSIVATGRLSGDALGSLTQGELTLRAGGGSQTGNLHRWGDYASVTPDPVDDCTFWATTQYLPADGAFNWATRIAAFKLPGCTAPADNFSLSTTPTTARTIAAGGLTTYTVSPTVTVGSAQTVALTAGNLPAGVSATFSNPSPSTGGTSTLTVAAAPWVTPATYAITVRGATGSIAHSRTVLLTVVEPTYGGVVNGGFETGTLGAWLKTGTATANSGGHSGLWSARIGSSSPTAGASTLRQTFKAPVGHNRLTFWWRQTCPGGILADWASVTLTDTSTAAVSTPLAKTCSTFTTWRQITVPIVPGRTYTLTITNSDNNVVGGASRFEIDDIKMVHADASTVVNPGFESATLAPWVSVGTVTQVGSAHSGAKAVQLGSTTPTAATATTHQTFTAPAGSTQLSFWWYGSCTGTSATDWARATLGDLTTSTVTTPLARTCTTTPAWRKVTMPIVGGHRYDLSLQNNDDGGAAGATFTRYDDIEIL